MTKANRPTGVFHTNIDCMFCVLTKGYMSGLSQFYCCYLDLDGTHLALELCHYFRIKMLWLLLMGKNINICVERHIEGISSLKLFKIRTVDKESFKICQQK